MAKPVFFFYFLVSVRALAQPAQPTCSCAALLNESIQKVSTVYAGFDDKVTPQTRSDYNRLIAGLQTASLHATGSRACYELIKKYTDWFKDGHVGIWYGTPSSAGTIRKVTGSTINPPVANPIEGLWTTQDKKQEYAIISDPDKTNEWVAVVRSTIDSAWLPGMVKVEYYGYDEKLKMYRGLFYQTNFYGVMDGFTLRGNRMDHWFGPSWYRVGATTGAEVKENTETVQLKIINKDFVYLKLGKFNQNDVNKLDSLINANRALIYSTKNLILDLRGNPGGDANSSKEMIQLIYTNPLVYPPWQYRSSPELIQSKRNEIEALKKNDPWKMLNSQQALLGRLVEHPGQLVTGGDSIIRKSDSIAHYPERVALLVDGGSGSSAEFFTFEGKQSKKVVLFGANTAGVMDYGEDQSINLSCGQYIVAVPWGRNGWIERFGYRIDNFGFKPDVTIPDSEPNWIDFIVKHWSN